MSAQTLVAVHQPNFFPWMGFFHKIVHADIFVALDDAQFPRTSRGTWLNRCAFLIAGKRRWMTVPILRPHERLQMISDAAIDTGSRWQDKLCGSLSASYSKAPFFHSLFPSCVPLLRNSAPTLAAYNLNAIKGLLDIMHLPGDHIVLASALSVTSAATQRLIDLTKAAGGNAYLCGGGAQGYQEDGLFAEQGVSLLHQNFVPPAYPQRNNGGPFVPGLSILDALFNIGPEATARLLRETCPPKREG